MTALFRGGLSEQSNVLFPGHICPEQQCEEYQVTNASSRLRAVCKRSGLLDRPVNEPDERIVRDDDENVSIF